MTRHIRSKNPTSTPFSPPPAGALRRRMENVASVNASSLPPPINGANTPSRRWRTKPSRSRDCGSRIWPTARSIGASSTWPMPRVCGLRARKRYARIRRRPSPTPSRASRQATGATHHGLRHRQDLGVGDYCRDAYRVAIGAVQPATVMRTERSSARQRERPAAKRSSGLSAYAVRVIRVNSCHLVRSTQVPCPQVGQLGDVAPLFRLLEELSVGGIHLARECVLLRDLEDHFLSKPV